MPDALHEHMNRYLEERASLDPKCMRCGEPAHWQMQGVGHLQMLRPPEILCQQCLSGVDPVRVPVYSDPPAHIPLRRWPWEAHKPQGKGTRLWLGFQMHLAIVTADEVCQNNQFLGDQFLNHPDIIQSTFEGMSRSLVEELCGRQDAAPPE